MTPFATVFAPIPPRLRGVKGRSWVAWALAATAIVVLWGPSASAADRYWDTSDTSGLQGGSGSLNGSNWSTNVSGTGTRVAIGTANDVFFQATTGSLTYSGTFTNGTNLTINNWTVANRNVVTTKRGSGAGGTTFTISGTILVTGSSAMNWELLSWSLGGNPALTIQQSSTNTIVGNAGANDKALSFGALTFGSGSNAFRMVDSGGPAVSATFTSLSGAAGNSIFLEQPSYSLTLNNTAASSFSGVISGSGSLIKQGAGSLTLGGTNTYSGATTISGGSIVLGTAHALSNNSAVTIANATLTTGSFSDTVASLTSGTGTINMTITGGTVGGLSMAGLTLNGSNTLAITLDNPTLGRYSLFNYSGSRTGTFSTVSGATDWNVIYGSASNSTIDLQQKANQAWAVTPANTRALLNTNVALTGSLTNTSGSGASSLTVSASSTGLLSISGLPTGTVVGGSSTTVSATIAAGSTLGSRTWSIVNTDANAITTSATATGTITVVADRTFTSSTIAFGRFLNTTNPLSGTSTITSLGLSATTANATLGTFGGSNGLTLALASGTNVFSGTGATQSATYTTSGSYNGALGAIASGLFTGTATNEFGNTSTVNVAYTGTAVQDRTYTSPATIDLGRVLNGTVLNTTAVVTSTQSFATTATGTLGGSASNFNGVSLTGSNFVFNGTNTTGTYTLAGTVSSPAGSTIGGTYFLGSTNEFGTLTGSAATVAFTGTVIDAAVASFASGSTSTSLLLDFGSQNQFSSVSPLLFSLFNLEQTAGFTADLALYEIDYGLATSPELTTNLTTFFDLAAGLSNPFSASLSTLTTGTFENTYTLRLKSANDGVVYAGTAPQVLTLVTKAIIVVPEPGTVVAGLLGIGLIGFYAVFFRRRKGVRNAAISIVAIIMCLRITSAFARAGALMPDAESRSWVADSEAAVDHTASL